MKNKRAQRRLGLLLMASSLSLGVIAPFAAAAATTAPEDQVAVESVREGFWQTDNSNFSKNAATKQFPPEAVCLVQPAACTFPEDDETPQGQLGAGGNQLIGEAAQGNKDLQAGISDAEQQYQDGLADNDGEQGAVPPGTLPVSIAFGYPNYRSAVEFVLPALPAGESPDTFFVALSQTNPTYSNSSPALRQAVLAGLTCASENPDSEIPEEFPVRRCKSEEFEKVVSKACSDDPEETGPCPREDAPLLVEMCPIVESDETEFDDTAWKEARGQDENTLPAVNCLFGAQGIALDDGTWVFDMTFAAKGWYDGSLPNAGVLMRPGAAENFAYGDAESTYSKQVTFENDASAAVKSSPPPPPPAPFVPPTPAEPAPQQQPQPQPQTFTSTDSFGTPTTTTTTSVPISSGTTSVPATSSQPQAPVVQQPVVGSQGQTTTPVAVQFVPGVPTNPWWLWLLIPIFLMGSYLLSQSLASQGLVPAGATTGGAMTRLLERQAATRSSSLITR